MRQHPAVFVFLLAMLFFSLGARGSQPMYMPPAIAVQEGLSLEDISSAITDTLKGRKWSIDTVTITEGDNKGRIFTTLHVRVHELTIKFLFDKNKIKIQYVRSVNLGYKERKDKKYIHPKYHQWIHNLEVDLKTNLGQ